MGAENAPIEMVVTAPDNATAKKKQQEFFIEKVPEQ
jgi:hypothetical protein